MARPHSARTGTTSAPQRSAISMRSRPKRPHSPTTTRSPGSTRETMAASSPARPVPGTGKARAFSVWKTKRVSAITSFMIAVKSGSNWPSSGAAMAWSTRGSAMVGPGPIKTREVMGETLLRSPAMGKPLGRPTRGKTAPNRLRKTDAFLAVAFPCPGAQPARALRGSGVWRVSRHHGGDLPPAAAAGSARASAGRGDRPRAGGGGAALRRARPRVPPRRLRPSAATR